MKKPTYTFTTTERQAIRSWLEKKPGSDVHPKVWIFVKDDGTEVPITRVTQYIPGGKWKVRIAFTEDGGYPIMMSGPLTSGSDMKKNKPGELVPKDYATFKVHAGTPKPGNTGAFAKAIDAELASLKKSIHAQINAPFVWDDINPLVEE